MAYHYEIGRRDERTSGETRPRGFSADTNFAAMVRAETYAATAEAGPLRLVVRRVPGARRPARNGAQSGQALLSEESVVRNFFTGAAAVVVVLLFAIRDLAVAALAILAWPVVWLWLRLKDYRRSGRRAAAPAESAKPSVPRRRVT